MLDQDDERTRIITLFLLASAVLVTAAVIVFAVVIVAGRTGAASQVTNGLPYNLNSRPYPTTTDLAQILPPTLGKFKRSLFSGSLSDFSATYTADVGKIMLSGSQTVSLALAEFSVQQASKTVTGLSNKDLGSGDPSYFLLAPETGPARYVWSHNRWYFDVKATSKAALDEFMKVFKY